MATVEIWTYREQTGAADLTGYRVEALDGSIGKIDEASNDVGSSFSWSTPARGSSGRRSCSRRAWSAASTRTTRRSTSTGRRSRSRTRRSSIRTLPRRGYHGELGAYYGRGGAGWRAS